jgi:predicted transcriptional regulator of viral defense system
MTVKRTSFEQLLERAAAQHGFVRPADADELGVSKVYLRKLAVEGRAEHRGHGLYRITALPVTPLDEYHEAVLWAGDGAAIAAQSALALWELADVNPRQIEVVVPAGRRVRRKNPGRYRVRTEALADRDIDFVDGIPVVTPDVAIRQVIDDGLEGTLIQQAITGGRARNMFNPLAEARLRVALADRNQKVHDTIRANRKVSS